KISLLVDLDPIQRIFAFSMGHVEEEPAIRKGPVSTDLIAHDDFLVVIPVADIEIFLVRREGNTIGTLEIGAHQLQFSFVEAEDAAVGQFLSRVAIEFGKSKRRVSEEQRPI